MLEEQLQPLANTYPSSFTLLDALVIKLVGRISWSEFSLLCAHTLCNAIGHFTKVASPGQTLDTGKFSENASLSTGCLNKEVHESIF